MRQFLIALILLVPAPGLAQFSEIPLGEVVHILDVHTFDSDGNKQNADSTPTCDVFEEDTDTPIVSAQNMTARVGYTGEYRFSFTASTGNGFEVGKWYSATCRATIDALVQSLPRSNFRIVATENTAGTPLTETSAMSADVVTAAAIAADAIGASELATDAIGAAEIASAAIAADEIATDAIGALEVAADAIGASELATDAIGAAELATDAIGAAEIASAAIAADEIATDAIGAAEIAADAIGASEIATDAIGAAELAADAAEEAGDAWGDEVIETNGSITVRQAICTALSVLAGETTNNGLTFQDPSGTTTRVTATVNASNERTTMVLAC